MRNELAALHDQAVIGQLLGEVAELLDQQNRYVAPFGQHSYHAADVLDDAELDTVGRLVQHQQSGFGGQRLEGKSTLHVCFYGRVDKFPLAARSLDDRPFRCDG